MGFGGTGDEIIAMKEGWLTASVLRPIDDSAVGVADALLRTVKVKLHRKVGLDHSK